MLETSVRALVFGLVVIFYVPTLSTGQKKADFEKVDLKKVFKDHSECNGETLVYPPEWLVEGLLTAAQCLDIRDDFCKKQCMAMSYPGMMKDGQIDHVWIRNEGKKLKLSKRNEKAQEEAWEAIKKCSTDFPKLEKPTPTTKECPYTEVFQMCLEEEFGYICRGQKRETTPLPVTEPNINITTSSPH